MGLTVSIYRTPGRDCTNGGVSAFGSELTLINVDGPVDPSFDAPAAKLVPGHLPGTVRIVPEAIPEKRHSMFGGNYAATSDSRFTRAVEAIVGGPFYGAVAIHDRLEN